jgi:L-ascorbate metabolism protein UlaG (beta-lactamase superfamily)
MKLQLIRNATLLLDYAGHHLLIDPYFAPIQSRPSYTGKGDNINPIVELPLTPEQTLEGVELVIVSHLHSDHFDPVAHERVPKHLPLLCQPGNETFIREKGFQNVRVVDDDMSWKGIHIIRTNGHHGTGEVETMMGTVSGFVFQAKREPTLYWAGDTIMCAEVRTAIAQFHPDVVVTHSCGATWADSAGQRSLIVMDDAQTIETCRYASEALVIAAHMEALDHSTISRAALRAAAEAAGVSEEWLRIPADGDLIEITV